MLHALAERDRVAAGKPLAGPLAQQRALADARFAAHQHDLATPGRDVHLAAAQLREGGCAADERRQCGDERRTRRGGQGRAKGGRPCLAGLVDDADADEAIAAPRHGFDVAGPARVVREGGSDRVDGCLQHGLADEAASPHRIEQLVLRDQKAGSARKVAENRECLGREVNDARALRQPSVGGFEAKRAEAQHHGARR